ncbi:MAG: ABC transporter substrate-binding protein [Lachnospiraceae bacterium]|nr:ABC transporter substrate-binding protein [Lachnospiraceae bacterium]
MKKKAVSAVLAAVLSMSMMAGCTDATATGNTGSTGTQDGPAATEAPAADAGSADAGSADAGTADTTAAGGSLTGTLKLGMIGPLTGGAAIYGNAVKNGEQIAVDEINAISSDFQIEYNPQDDEHDAEKSVNAYHNLQDWGLQVIAGTVTTTPCVAVSAEANADRIFMLTPSASSPTVTEGKDNMFQLCFSDPNQGSASAQYIADNKMASKVAVIYNNSDAYSTGIYQTFNTKASELGLEIVSTTTFTDDTANDFSVQLADAKDNGAELVFLPIYYQPASLILQQAKGMGYEPTFFGVDGMDGILTMEGFDASLAEGVILLTPFSADAADDLTKNFVATYNTNYGETPNQFAADGYDCPYAIYRALQFYADKNGGLDVTGKGADELCEILISVFTDPAFSSDGVTGNGMVWTANGEVNKAPKAMVIENGVYVGL